MVTMNQINLQAGKIGDNVAVLIPTVDKRREDATLDVTVDFNDAHQYKTAVKRGILKVNGYYARSQLDWQLLFDRQ